MNIIEWLLQVTFFKGSFAKTMEGSAEAPSRDVGIGGKGWANGISSSAILFFHGIVYGKTEHIFTYIYHPKCGLNWVDYPPTKSYG